MQFESEGYTALLTSVNDEFEESITNGITVMLFNGSRIQFFDIKCLQKLQKWSKITLARGIYKLYVCRELIGIYNFLPYYDKVVCPPL